jgi:Cys-tRNA(Pro)/Cys-tRNA(Cys) deacylase
VSDTPALVDSRLIGTEYIVHRHGPVDSLEEAATLRGVEPSAIVKTIVVRKNEDDYAFILVPGDRVIDWPKLRDHLGQRRLSMPDADEAFAVTGYVRGTITPFGSTNPWPVTADEAIVGTIVSIGGGAPGVSLTMNGDSVIQMLGAEVADVTKTR